jgi:two-component system response regulator DesR
MVMETKKLRILLANENSSLRSALALLLETRMNAEIVGECYDMKNLLAQLRSTRPDIIILDSDLPGKPKSERPLLLHQACPALKVVLMGAQPRPAGRSLPLYITAYISKAEPPETMVQILRGI